MKKNRKPRNRPVLILKTVLGKCTKAVQWEKNRFFFFTTKGIGIIGQP